MHSHQNSGQNHTVKISRRFLRKCGEVTASGGTTVTIGIAFLKKAKAD
jgi:hypothetical protein